jgi:hypothetical protein
MYVMGISLIHLVKYSVTMITNLWLLNEVGWILPMILSPHCVKGHGDDIGQSSYVGACINSP